MDDLFSGADSIHDLVTDIIHITQLDETDESLDLDDDLYDLDGLEDDDFLIDDPFYEDGEEGDDAFVRQPFWIDAEEYTNRRD